MKIIFEKIKLYIENYIIINWNSGKMFDKAKLIFMGLVLFFLIWKITYHIFKWI